MRRAWGGLLVLTCALGSGPACRSDPPQEPPRSEIPPWRVERGPGGQEYRVVARGRYRYFFDLSGVARRITFDLNVDGRPEATAVVSPGGVIEEVLLDWNANGSVDRHEYRAPVSSARPLVWGDRSNESRWADFEGLAASPPPIPADRIGKPVDPSAVARAVRGAFRAGALARVRLDSDGDEKLDREQTWSAGRVTAELIDTDADGILDLRLEYTARGVVARSTAARSPAPGAAPRK